MTYKKGMTKSKYKAKMRNFWDDRWYHNVSIETWCGLLTNEKLTMQLCGQVWTSSQAFNQRRANELIFNELIFDAIEKLILEKKLTKDEAETLRNMLRSKDKENVHLAVMIIAKIKPKVFAKNVDKIS